MDLDLGINFAPPATSAGSSKSKSAGAKGGKWTQRSNAKQKTRRLSGKQVRQQTAREREASDSPPPALPVSQPEPSFKKPAKAPVSKPSKATAQSSSQSTSKKPREGNDEPEEDAGASQAAAPRKGGAFISSLFSSMPQMPAPSADTEPTEAGLPSNAPSQGSFAPLALYPEIINCLKSSKFGLEHPTPVQTAAVPALHRAAPGSDFIVQAQTGSGKTLAYLLPIVQDLLRVGEQLKAEGNPPHRQLGTMAIVLVPTRELANQVHQVALNLLSMSSGRKEKEDGDEQDQPEHVDTKGRPHTWITPGLLSGGMSRQHEKARLRKGVPLLIATPGRLIDHLETTASFHIAGEYRKPAPANHGAKKQKNGKQNESDDDFDVEDQPFEPGEDEASSGEEFAEYSRSYKPRKRFGAPDHHQQQSYKPVSDPRLALRWLVLDEADRLVDMGFEPQVQKVLTKLRERQEASAARLSASSPPSENRKNVLCSATMQGNVKKLAGQVLNSPVMLRGDPTAEAQASVQYKPPEQLAQSYVVIPPKLRLVALVALLRQVCVLTPRKDNTTAKAVVFLSCIDAVDFLWKALGGLQMGQPAAEGADDGDQDEDKKEKSLAQRSPVIAGVPIFRLHGNLDITTRLGSLKGFTGSSEGGILLCTSLAARGLDVPFVNSVIQYDLPTEGGLTEYVHRVGRTARAGQSGSSWAFLLPSEVGWVDWAKQETGARLREFGVNDVLKDGFGGKGKEFESRATDVQLGIERWVEAKPSHADLARNAFTSHVRAYATHPSSEKHMFHRKNLHLGHLAKAFGLREAPAGLGRQSAAHKKEQASQPSLDAPGQRKKRKKAAAETADYSDDSGDDQSGDEEHDEENDRPSKPKLPRTGRGAEGRGLKPARAGQASEFNVGSTADLESLVRRSR